MDLLTVVLAVVTSVKTLTSLGLVVEPMYIAYELSVSFSHDIQNMHVHVCYKCLIANCIVMVCVVSA